MVPANLRVQRAPAVKPKPKPKPASALGPGFGLLPRGVATKATAPRPAPAIPAPGTKPAGPSLDDKYDEFMASMREMGAF